MCCYSTSACRGAKPWRRSPSCARSHRRPRSSSSPWRRIPPSPGRRYGPARSDTCSRRLLTPSWSRPCAPPQGGSNLMRNLFHILKLTARPRPPNQEYYPNGQENYGGPPHHPGKLLSDLAAQDPLPPRGSDRTLARSFDPLVSSKEGSTDKHDRARRLSPPGAVASVMPGRAPGGHNLRSSALPATGRGPLSAPLIPLSAPPPSPGTRRASPRSPPGAPPAGNGRSPPARSPPPGRRHS
jgi:hypothetical protein